MDKLKRHIDIVGILTSGVCALHCLLLPIIISLGLIDGYFTSAMHDVTEVLIVLGSFAMAFYSVHSGIKSHRNNTPYWFFGVGLMTLITGLSMGSHIAMAIGGVLVAIAHVLNYRLLHRKPVIC